VNACNWKPSLVILHDGRQVMSDSEEWRLECEAVTILSMPLASRRTFLRGKLDDKGALRDGVFQRRGEAACLKLEDAIKKIWYSRRSSD
jgi:hypothetical protein